METTPVTQTPSDQALLEQLALRDARIAALETALRDGEEHARSLPGQTALRGMTAVIEVFWPREGKYSSECSARVAVPPATVVEDIHVELPGTAVGPLRIDPGYGPGVWRVDAIMLRAIDEQGALVEAPLAQWSQAGGWAGLTVGQGVYLDGTGGILHLICWGDDPQVLLQLPSRTDERPWMLTLRCRHIEPLYAVIENHVQRMFVLVEEGQRAGASYGARIEKLAADVASAARDAAAARAVIEEFRRQTDAALQQAAAAHRQAEAAEARAAAAEARIAAVVSERDAAEAEIRRITKSFWSRFTRPRPTR